MASSQKSTARSAGTTEAEKNNNREMLLTTHRSVPQPLRPRALSADRIPHDFSNHAANKHKKAAVQSWSSEKSDGVAYMDKTNRPKSLSHTTPRVLSADNSTKKGKHYLPAQIVPIVDRNSNDDEDETDKYVSSKLGVKPSLVSSEKTKLRKELRRKISRAHSK